jgi:hypothetical protein
MTCTSNAARVSVMLANLVPALKKEVSLGVLEATQYLKEDTHGQDKHRFKNHTDVLEKSVDTELISFNTGKVFLDLGVAPYGKFVHNGTEQHWVGPKNGKALSWFQGGKRVFSKGHLVAGIKADPFLYIAARRSRKEIINILDRSCKRALETLNNGTK